MNVENKLKDKEEQFKVKTLDYEKLKKICQKK